MKLNRGAVLEANKMTMVITGETKTAYQGYYMHKGKPVGQCSLEKSAFNNMHLAKRIKIISNGQDE